MKIEKVNDNQIKLYLDKHDLEDRHMCLADIAYGSDFANEFFTQIIRDVNLKTGFDTENVPLMVEAIPTGKDSLVLIVTRCDDPEELDTRFSRFTPSPNKYEKSLDENGEYMEIRKKTPRHAASNDEKLANLNAAAKRVSETLSGGSGNNTPNLSREKINSLLFIFNSIQDVMKAAARIQVHPSITSSLYKNLSGCQDTGSSFHHQLALQKFKRRKILSHRKL